MQFSNFVNCSIPPLVKKVSTGKQKKYIHNEVCRMSKKNKSLEEFVLPDPTMKVEVNLGCCVQIHSKKLMGQERFLNFLLLVILCVPNGSSK